MLGRNRTRQWLLQSLDQARRRWDLELWAYVTMPEHVHLLLLPRRDDYHIRLILKAIKQPVAQRAVKYLKEHAPTWLDRLKVTRPSGRTEYRFWQQGGGYDRDIVSPTAAWASVAYIHNNPVRRGLVNAPTDWAWSSAKEYAGIDGALLRG